jgi:hypothetical protein
MNPFPSGTPHSGTGPGARPIKSQGLLARFLHAARRIAREWWDFCVGRPPAPTRVRR